MWVLKRGRKCGPSCQCHDCQNVLLDAADTSAASDQDEIVSDQEEASEGSDDEFDSELIETEIISDLYHEQNNFTLHRLTVFKCT